MEQKRSRLVAPDATGLRARILSTGGLLVVAALVLVVLVMLYPRQQLLDRLRAEPRNDELSVSYLANLLTSEPDNDDLRILLAERHFSLKQPDRAEAALQPLLGKTIAHEDIRLRLSRLTYSLLELRANAATPGSAQAQVLRAQLVAGLQERLTQPWSTPDLLLFARKATALEQLPLAQRFHGLIRFDADGDRAPWFEEAVRTAIWAQDYVGAATLHQRAMALHPTVERKRWHLREALRILQSGNLLGQALTLAQSHADIVSDDRALLDYLTRLALAANQPAVAEGYARRLLQMSALPMSPPAQVLRWMAAAAEAAVDLVVSPALAADPGRATPVERKAAEPAGIHLVPGDPRLPFEEASYLLAYQTFLANRNQTDAWRVASSAVRQQPENAAWRERLAQVSEWVGKPEDALDHWRALSQMQGADRSMVDNALKAMLRLAPSLNDDELLLDTWGQIAAVRRLTVDETLGVVALTERLGRPEEGMRWLQEGDRRQPTRALLEAQVDLAERMGDPPSAIDALRRLIQRDGATSARAIRLATMHGLRGESAMAYEAMAPLASRVPESDLDYWRLMANLAWTLQIESQALHALTITTRTGQFDSIDADRLLTLLRLRDPHEAARFAEKAWGVLHLPGYLLTALDLWWNAHEPQQMARLFASVEADADKLMAEESYFWMLRSQWRQSRGEMLAALADMRRALEADPALTQTRIAYLFLLIESGAKGELQRMLTIWLEVAMRDPAYDSAYAAGYMELDQARQALPFWRRQAVNFRDDPMWTGSYADVLEAAGQFEQAGRVRALALHLTRERLLEAQTQRREVSAEALQSLRLQLARLTLADGQGDASLRTVRQLLAKDGLLAPGTVLPPRLDTDAQSLLLGWMLSNERHDHARLWLWRRHAHALATPAWAEMTMALHDGDLSTVNALLDGPDGDRLPTALRIDALQTLGHPRRAQTLRIAQLQERDDDGQHETYTDAAWRDARRVEYGVEAGRDTLRTTQQTLALWLPLTETARLKVSAQDTLQRPGTLDSGEPAFGHVPSHDRAGSVTLQFRPDRALQVEGTLGARSAERSFTTAGLSATAQVMSRLQVRADLGVNAPVADSAPLAVAARQHEARLSADLRLALTNPVRVALRAAQFSLQGGSTLGSAFGLEWEAAQVLRGGTPDLSVRAFGNYTRYRRREDVLPSWTASLTPDGSLPGTGYFMPDSFALHGIGLSAGLAQRDTYNRAWRPFLDFSLTTHSRLGTGHAATFGASGRLLGSDQLLVQFTTTRAGAGGDVRSLGLRYVRPF